MRNFRGRIFFCLVDLFSYLFLAISRARVSFHLHNVFFLPKFFATETFDAHQMCASNMFELLTESIASTWISRGCLCIPRITISPAPTVSFCNGTAMELHRTKSVIGKDYHLHSGLTYYNSAGVPHLFCKLKLSIASTMAMLIACGFMKRAWACQPGTDHNVVSHLPWIIARNNTTCCCVVDTKVPTVR